MRLNSLQERNRLENARLDDQTRRGIHEHLAWLKERNEQTQQQAVTWVQQYEDLQLSCTHLDGLKGIGLDSAMLFVSLIGDVTCTGYSGHLFAKRRLKG